LLFAVNPESILFCSRAADIDVSGRHIQKKCIGQNTKDKKWIQITLNLNLHNKKTFAELNIDGSRDDARVARGVFRHVMRPRTGGGVDATSSKRW
jgi:hypothetical protein